MKKLFLSAVFLFPTVLLAGNTNWVVDSGKISYEADHPFHNTVGRSNALKGKGLCESGNCEFLVAAPVKSFESGDSNRDTHMIQAVKGAQFPLVSVRAKFPESALASGTIAPDLVVNFGGVEVTYPKVSLTVASITADSFRITGQLPLDLISHKIDRPSLFGVAVKSAAPVDVDVTWKKGN